MARGVNEQERQGIENSERDDIKYKQWTDITEIMLNIVNLKSSSFRERSISMVPDELSKWNENAYMPKVISIGPRYNGGKELLPIEEIKWRSMSYLLNRSRSYTQSLNECIKKCMDAMLRMDVVVRASYMLNDGCFLLELLISGSSTGIRLAPEGNIGRSPALEIAEMEVVMRDLSLLENQIPLFILNVLFQNIFPLEQHILHGHIHYVALCIFGFNASSRLVDYKFAHFLEMASWNIHKEWEELQNMVENEETQIASSVIVRINDQQVKYQRLNRCATRLAAFGVKIKSKPPVNDTPTEESTLTFGNLKFGTIFNNSTGILEILPVHITQTTEAKWRSLIAWEHHKKWIKPKSSSDTENENQRWFVATSSALLFNDLICCSSDVQLLKDAGVIVVDGDLNMKNRDLMALFHSLTKGVDRGIIDPKYSSNFDALNKYSATNCTTRITRLVRHYFCRIFNWFYTFWKFLRHGYNFAATALTLLTVVQTVYTLLSYHLPKS